MRGHEHGAEVFEFGSRYAEVGKKSVGRMRIAGKAIADFGMNRIKCELD